MNKNTVKLLFECSVNKRKILKSLNKIGTLDEKERYIRKNLNNYLERNLSIYNEIEDWTLQNRLMGSLIEKDFKEVKDLMNFEVIHAKRNVASSEEERVSAIFYQI